MDYEIISERQEKVLRYLTEHDIPFTTYNHPEGKTIEEAKRWWRDDGSVSPFGLINDIEHHVILFLDSRLKDATSLSFHPNDCRGTIVISQSAFQKYLASVGNKVEYIQTTGES